jgi:hypothetical protein
MDWNVCDHIWKVEVAEIVDVSQETCRSIRHGNLNVFRVCVWSSCTLYSQQISLKNSVINRVSSCWSFWTWSSQAMKVDASLIMKEAYVLCRLLKVESKAEWYHCATTTTVLSKCIAPADCYLFPRWKHSLSRSTSTQRKVCRVRGAVVQLLAEIFDSKRDLLWRWFAVTPAVVIGKLTGSKVHELFEAAIYRNQIVYICTYWSRKNFAFDTVKHEQLSVCWYRQHLCIYTSMCCYRRRILISLW